jgi:[protein-PII] uridylyltransferase
LTLVTEDRPGLFALIAGTLASFGMNILKAEAFANRHGAILDTFTFADPLRSLELNSSEGDRLRAMLERVVLGKADVKHMLQNRPKPVLPSRKSRIEPRVSFDSEASRSATLIQIVAEDRPGLLYDVAATLSGEGCNIEVVLIDTEAHKAIDVFYVTAGGQKLHWEKCERLADGLRRVCGAA